MPILFKCVPVPSLPSFIARACAVLLFVVAASTGLTSCGKKVDLEDPKHYKKGAISFNYPANWDIDQEQADDDIQYIVIESPGSGLFVVQAHTSAYAMDLKDFAEWFSEEAAANMPIVERSIGDFTPITTLPSKDLNAGLSEYFAISLFGQQVPHQAAYYLAEKGDVHAFIITQYREDISAELAPGYKLIFDSLKVESQ